MLSPLNDPNIKTWFQHLDAAWHRMPAEEQAKQREEVQQHLEALVAARVAAGQSPETAWKASLMQFGDPKQIGRKMYQEWCLSKTSFGTDVIAILVGAGLDAIRYLVTGLLWSFWFNRLYDPADKLYTHGLGIVGLAEVVLLVTSWGGNILVGIIIGRKYPLQALKATFYTCVISRLWVFASLAFSLRTHPNVHVPLGSLWYWNMVIAPLSWLLCTVVAYLASVTKRGWYKPTLGDFKLTLPKRRQISR